MVDKIEWEIKRITRNFLTSLAQLFPYTFNIHVFMYLEIIYMSHVLIHVIHVIQVIQLLMGISNDSTPNSNVWVFFPTPASNPPTLAECPMIQLNSDTIYSKRASHLTG